MKRFLILMMMIFGALVMRSQTITEIKLSQDIYLVNNLNIAAMYAAGKTDTAFYFKLFKIPTLSWSIENKWTSFTDDGQDSSYVSLEVTNVFPFTSADWIPYYGPLKTTLTAGAGKSGWEDNLWSWKYARIRLHLDGGKTGRLTSIININ